MPDYYDLIKDKVDEIVAEYKKAVADGSLEFKEAIQLAVLAGSTFIKLAAAIPSASGADKKAAVHKALMRFYDEIVAPLDIPKIPGFVEKSIVDPTLRVVWSMVADAMIDALVKLLKELNALDDGSDDSDGGTATSEGNN